jgi:chromosome segregation ATPase
MVRPEIERRRGSLRDVVLQPAARAPRVVGPGRRERSYLQRVAELEGRLEGRRQELAVAQRIERGCQRRLDRLEDRLEDRSQALAEALRQQRRMALLLGGLQRDNERLQAQLTRQRVHALGAAQERRRGVFARLFARGGSA